MITNYFIGFLLIYLINSNPLERNRCDLCNLTGDFIPSNGYECFITNDYKVICTCPDYLQSTINRPCRICQRENICGQSNALCSEDPTFFNLNNKNSHFACLCSSGLYQFDNKCPQEINPQTSQINEIYQTTIISISTTNLIEETTNLIEETTNLIQETTNNSLTTTTTTNIYTEQINSNSMLTNSLIEETSTPIYTTINVPMSSINFEKERTTIVLEDATTNQFPTIGGCRSTSSHIFVKTYLIILSNLVYFLNK